MRMCQRQRANTLIFRRFSDDHPNSNVFRWYTKYILPGGAWAHARPGAGVQARASCARYAMRAHWVMGVSKKIIPNRLFSGKILAFFTLRFSQPFEGGFLCVFFETLSYRLVIFVQCSGDR